MQHMTHIDLPTLKALAEKAHLSSPAAEKFHDAASPATVLGLIARVEKAEAELATAREKALEEAASVARNWYCQPPDRGPGIVEQIRALAGRK